MSARGRYRAAGSRDYGAVAGSRVGPQGQAGIRHGEVADVMRILRLWRGRAVWLGGGVVVSLAALAMGIALMGLAGATVGAAVAAGVLVAPVALRGVGAARVVLRYAERLVTHAATFRALADLRVWFFRNLARTGGGWILRTGCALRIV